MFDWFKEKRMLGDAYTAPVEASVVFTQRVLDISEPVIKLVEMLGVVDDWSVVITDGLPPVVITDGLPPIPMKLSHRSVSGLTLTFLCRYFYSGLYGVKANAYFEVQDIDWLTRDERGILSDAVVKIMELEKSRIAEHKAQANIQAREDFKRKLECNN